MKTRFLSGFLAVVGGGAAIVGCFEPTNKVKADSPLVVTAPSSATPIAPLSQQPTEPVATPPPSVSAIPTTLSPGISEVAKLHQSNVSEDVLLAYINNYGQPFHATADEILYLNDLGVSDNVVTALLNHKADGAEPPQRIASVEPQPAAQPAAAPAATAPLVPPQQVSTAVAPGPEVTVNAFYDTLSPYGTWVETDYGRCWRPAVVVSNPTWRPYCDRGHWVYTDCGWYWASDYSWGWATFHYGRWCTDTRFGWVWVPDSTWGPSWVSWRYTSDYCGWAPLPPAARYRPGVGFTYHSASVSVSFDFGLTDFCYTFVPVHRFCDPQPYRYYAPRTSTTTIYRNSTVINNYIVNNNSTTVINEGVGRKRIEAATKQPVQKVAIHEVPSNSAPVGSPDRIHKVGNDLVLYKPKAPSFVKPQFAAKPLPVENRNVSTPFSRAHDANVVNAAPGNRNDHPWTPARSNENSPNAIVKHPASSQVTEPVVAPNSRTIPVDSGNDRPKHGRHDSQPNVISATPKPEVKPLAEARPVAQAPVAPVQRTAPLVPSGNIYRENSKFESPRNNTPAYSPAAPSSSSAPSQAPTPSHRENSAPSTPRQSVQPSERRQHDSGPRSAPGQSRSEGNPRSEGNGRGVDRDSNNPGQGGPRGGRY